MPSWNLSARNLPLDAGQEISGTSPNGRLVGLIERKITASCPVAKPTRNTRRGWASRSR